MIKSIILQDKTLPPPHQTCGSMRLSAASRSVLNLSFPLSLDHARASAVALRSSIKNKLTVSGFVIAFGFLIFACLLFTLSCDRNAPVNSEPVEINERVFISLINDIYINSEEYEGRTIKLEGIFKTEQLTEEETPYCFVIRYGPGCCGYDGNAGFEVAWKNKEKPSYPANDSWVEATGVLKKYSEYEMEYLYLDLTSLNVLNTRGAEYVTQ